MVSQATTATRIPNHRICDLKSFDEVTKRDYQVAGLYFFSSLDCLVDLAYEISHDFFRRPYLYTNLPKSDGNKESAKSDKGSTTIAPILAKLHARYGTDETLLAKSQRDEIYRALFGKKGAWIDEDGDFPRLRNELVNACAAFAERVFDTGVEMLRERVRTTHRPFREYLTGLQGDSIRWSREEALSGLTEEISYPILRNPGVAAVFGISTFPKRAWPYAEDSNADKLVEEISKQLKWRDKTEETNIADNSAGKCITREHISNLQRAALRGAEALATIIDYDERADQADRDDSKYHNLDLLITKCYTWGSALLSLKAYPSMAYGELRVSTGAVEARLGEKQRGGIVLRYR
jgi:hypothetical protein